MSILSDGIPMTNGEVYALLRRRRDERNAMLHPSFGLQFSGSSAATTSSSQPQPSMHAQQSQRPSAASPLLFWPPAALQQTPASPNGLFAAPAAAQLLVLLTEVRTLRYLSRFGTIGSTGRGVGEVYGPTSIHTQQTPLTGTTEDIKAAAEALRLCRPGTITHVEFADKLLSYYEEKGQQVERLTASKVKAILRKIVNPSNTNHNDDNNNNNMNNNSNIEIANNVSMEGLVKCEVLSDLDLTRTQPKQTQQKGGGLGNGQRLFAAPSVPLAMFADSDGAPRDESAPSQSFSGQWTESDVLRLVMARPRNSLDMYRVLDGLEECVGDDEEALARLEAELLRVFDEEVSV